MFTRKGERPRKTLQCYDGEIGIVYAGRMKKKKKTPTDYDKIPKIYPDIDNRLTELKSYLGDCNLPR